MRKSGLLKIIIGVGLSILLIINLVKVVNAADGDQFDGWDGTDAISANNTIVRAINPRSSHKYEILDENTL